MATGVLPAAGEGEGEGEGEGGEGEGGGGEGGGGVGRGGGCLFFFLCEALCEGDGGGGMSGGCFFCRCAEWAVVGRVQRGGDGIGDGDGGMLGCGGGGDAQKEHGEQLEAANTQQISFSLVPHVLPLHHDGQSADFSALGISGDGDAGGGERGSSISSTDADGGVDKHGGVGEGGGSGTGGDGGGGEDAAVGTLCAPVARRSVEKNSRFVCDEETFQLTGTHWKP